MKEQIEMNEEKNKYSHIFPLDENSIILDTETTGFNDSEICEICIIDWKGKILLNSLVKPTLGIPKRLEEFHGITNELVANAPTFKDISSEILEILKNKQVIIYNRKFDTDVIRSSAIHSGMDPEIFPKEKDTLCAMNWYSELWAQDWHPYYMNYRSQKLINACAQQGIDINSVQAHRAEADCRLVLALINEVNRKLKEGIEVKTYLVEEVK